jgi:acyl-CoA thioesterase FadM
MVLMERDRRVTMADVDAAKILYVPTPYRWAEELWEEFLVGAGHPLSALFEEGWGCPTVANSAQYHAPLGLDDVVRCSLVLERVGRSSFTARMDAARSADAAPALQVWSQQVWVRIVREGEYEPSPVPGWIRDKVAGAAA